MVPLHIVAGSLPGPNVMAGMGAPDHVGGLIKEPDAPTNMIRVTVDGRDPPPMPLALISLLS
jgi:hypothetical protein